MRASVSLVLLLLGSMLASWPQSARAQSDRDFVFTDTDGHLVIRFVGNARAGLDSAQRYEVLNAEFSTMVHDRLHADLQFEDEHADPDWAARMEPEIAGYLRHAGPDFTDIHAECRAGSCRVVLEQPGHWSDIQAHQAVLETVQKSVQAFVAGRREAFEAAFMITAYYQEHETSHIKVFLRRTG